MSQKHSVTKAYIDAAKLKSESKAKPKPKSKKSRQATKMFQRPLPTSKKWAATVDLGWSIRAFRQRVDMSTTDLAKKTGLSQAQISRLENNQQGLRSGTLLKIAKALRVKPWVFFTTQNERQQMTAAKIALWV